MLSRSLSPMQLNAMCLGFERVSDRSWIACSMIASSTFSPREIPRGSCNRLFRWLDVVVFPELEGFYAEHFGRWRRYHAVFSSQLSNSRGSSAVEYSRRRFDHDSPRTGRAVEASRSRGPVMFIDPTTFAKPVLHLDSAASFVNITDRLPQAARCDVHQDSWWWGQFGYEELPSWFQLSKHYAGVSLGIDAYFDSWIPLRTKGGTTRISGWLPESLFLLSPVSRGHTA